MSAAARGPALFFSPARLKTERVRAGVSRETAAAAVDSCLFTFDRYERVLTPPGDVLARLADLYGVSVSQFYADREDEYVTAVRSAAGRLGDPRPEDIALLQRMFTATAERKRREAVALAEHSRVIPEDGEGLARQPKVTRPIATDDAERVRHRAG